ncbi:MAG: pyridoxamine kinase [Ruminococcaceae bacterium]|nr:pyridoxamine kinase [Oscillospiraceae bacterium]
MKRIVTMQDISCVGKCSLSVAIPIISAMGVECSVLPTAVLSTHTAFENFSICDLTDNLSPVTHVWKKEKIDFDMIYTAYLASVRQVDSAIELCRDFGGEGRTIFVDPVMGDFGRLYTGFEASYPGHMMELCKKADIISPNLTEAFCLLGEEYCENIGLSEALKMAKRLSDKGIKSVVITGVSPEKGKLGIVKYDREEDRYFSYFTDKVEASFPLHGSGDVFASAAVGAMASGFEVDAALRLAADFTAFSIEKSVKNEKRRWYGVDFETALPKLWELKMNLKG